MADNDAAMRLSIVVPVWNGAPVIASCLQAVFAHAGDDVLDVICVDNASEDDSAARIAAGFPNVALLCQPVNLGFAGGVNAGIAIARGAVVALLNQDCLPEPGWARAMLAAFEACPAAGVVGCTILSAGGTVDHAGAQMARPMAYGEHLTDLGDGRSRPADYVTGAAFAIRRRAIDAIGGFDEDYYPAYYEEADFCYRARKRGFEVIYAPQARVRHLRSSDQAHRFPVRHAANQHRQRYRFVVKHWSLDESLAFFTREQEAAASEPALHQAIGRVLAAKRTVRDLPQIIAARERDLDEPVSPAHRRLFEERFAELVPQAFAHADALAQTASIAAIHGAGAMHVAGGLRSRLGTAAAKLSGAARSRAALERRMALLAALMQHEFPG
jgi:GT2 family glycosyltransferase